MGNDLRDTSVTAIISLVLLFSAYFSTAVEGKTQGEQGTGQEAPLSVNTDKGTYLTGETVTVDGTVQNPIPNETVRLDI
jgi:hypothetical protein